MTYETNFYLLEICSILYFSLISSQVISNFLFIFYFLPWYMYTKVIHEGQSWIDETGITQSFEQLSYFLTCEISKCIQTCLHIAYGGEENAQDCSTSEEKTGSSLNNSTSPQLVETLKVGDDNKNFKKLEEIDTWMTKYSAQLRDLKQKIKRQEKQNELISSLWKEKTEVKFEGFMKELHSASDFMFSLQTQTETLNSRNKQHEEKLDNVMKKLTDLEKKTDLTINENLGLVKIEDIKLELDKIKNQLANTVKPQRDDFETAIQKLTEQEENMKTIKSDQESEKVKRQAVKEEIEISINMLDETIQTVRKDIKTLSSESMEQTNFSKKQLTKISSEVDGLLSDLTKLKSLNRKIVFHVGFTTRKVLLANTVAKYDHVITNVGDGYNVDTGVFTCPLAGHYFFQVFIMPDYKESALLGLYQNDECKLYVLGDNQSSTTGNGAVLYLKQFDKICLKSEKGCKLFGWPQKTYNTFTGFLLASY